MVAESPRLRGGGQALERAADERSRERVEPALFRRGVQGRIRVPRDQERPGEEVEARFRKLREGRELHGGSIAPPGAPLARPCPRQNDTLAPRRAAE
jgi:hypothetical protein